MKSTLACLTRQFQILGRLCQEEGLQMLLLQEANHPQGGSDDSPKAEGHGQRFPPRLLQM